MTNAALDEILTLQLAFAWAGESAPDADERRLGWWRTDMVAEFGGQALMKRLTPRTFEWAVLEAVRDAAWAVDARARQADAGADDLVSLFHLGHPIDEQLDDRLLAHKSAGVMPKQALPRLAELTSAPWNKEAFLRWLAAGPVPKHAAEKAGLRIKAAAPTSPIERARTLAALLATLPDHYPAAHFRDDAPR